MSSYNYINFSVIQPVGSIVIFSGKSDPNGWLICDGRSVSQSTYSNLYAIIGTNYGTGAGAASFNIPNFINFFPVGSTATGSLSVSSSYTKGSNSYTLTVANLPSHTHTGNTNRTLLDHTHSFNTSPRDDGNYSGLQGQKPAGDAPGQKNNSWWDTNNATPTHYHTFTTNYTGGSSPISLIPSSMPLNFIIKY